MRTIAVDLDGVVHRYSKGWSDGTIYDPPMPGAIAGLRQLMAQHAVFIHTTREPEGEQFGMIRPDKSLGRFGRAWERHVMTGLS